MSSNNKLKINEFNLKTLELNYKKEIKTLEQKLNNLELDYIEKVEN